MRLPTPIEPDIAATAALIGDPSRAAILIALADGRALPSGELARCAHVLPQTASAHLDKLFKGNLVAVEIQGRHHYYRLHDERVAELVESLAALAPSLRPLSQTQRAATDALRFARTCYGHLAGQLGVSLTQALFAVQVLDEDGDSQWRVTGDGANWLSDLGVDIDIIRRERRPLIKRCLDWSERRHHLAGGLGVAIARRLFDLNWVTGVRGSRAVRLTDFGRDSIRKRFGIEP